MNLVKNIESLLTDQITGQLGSLIGGNEKQTKSAINAAVPGLLASLGKVAMGGGKQAEALANTLGEFDTGMLGNLAEMFTSTPDKVHALGGGLLGNLLTSAMISRLAGAISKYTGLDSGTTTKLLGFLAPLILGAIAKHFNGKKPSVGDLTDLFRKQKGNIHDSLPGDIDLDDLWKRDEGRDTPTGPPAGPSLIKMLLPLAVLALLAYLAWQFLFPNKAEEPKVPPSRDKQVEVRDEILLPEDLEGAYSNAMQVIREITDADSATAALPQLKAINESVTGLGQAWDGLPEAAKARLADVTAENLEPLKNLIRPTLEIPGATEILAPVLTDLLKNLERFVVPG